MWSRAGIWLFGQVSMLVSMAGSIIRILQIGGQCGTGLVSQNFSSICSKLSQRSLRSSVELSSSNTNDLLACRLHNGNRVREQCLRSYLPSLELRWDQMVEVQAGGQAVMLHLRDRQSPASLIHRAHPLEIQVMVVRHYLSYRTSGPVLRYMPPSLTMGTTSDHSQAPNNHLGLTTTSFSLRVHPCHLCQASLVTNSNAQHTIEVLCRPCHLSMDTRSCQRRDTKGQHPCLSHLYRSNIATKRHSQACLPMASSKCTRGQHHNTSINRRSNPLAKDHPQQRSNHRQTYFLIPLTSHYQALHLPVRLRLHQSLPIQSESICFMLSRQPWFSKHSKK